MDVHNAVRPALQANRNGTFQQFPSIFLKHYYVIVFQWKYHKKVTLFNFKCLKFKKISEEKLSVSTLRSFQHQLKTFLFQRSFIY